MAEQFKKDALKELTNFDVSQIESATVVEGKTLCEALTITIKTLEYLKTLKLGWLLGIVVELAILLLEKVKTNNCS
jgi:hypothetical protein